MALCLVTASRAHADVAEVEAWYRRFVALIAADNYEAAVVHVHPYFPRVMVAELLDPQSRARSFRNNAPFGDLQRRLCRAGRAVPLYAKTFVEVTKGEYEVHVDGAGPDQYQMLANATVRIDNELQCRVELVAVDVERVNGRWYAHFIP